MTFVLPPLPYNKEALEPHIDARTMEIHHDKHHATYVNKLNEAIAKHPDLESKSIWELLADLNSVPSDIRTAVRNNGGGHANHSMFWVSMAPGAGGGPTGKLAEDIADVFGSFDAFKEEFSKAGMDRFGSGWAWLVVDAKGKLSVTSTPNQDNPISDGKLPLLGVDVWEHAYYLKYQNLRADYLKAWWNTVDWSKVGELYDDAQNALGAGSASEWTSNKWSKLGNKLFGRG